MNPVLNFLKFDSQKIRICLTCTVGGKGNNLIYV